jgi:CheY-like chemotaxis protein
MRTIAASVDYVQTLFEEAQEGKLGINAEGSVIVVDDDPVSNRLVVWALTQAGVVANSSEDPIRGLKLLQQKQYDLILLDVQMAVMDGFEFCRRARRLPAYAKTPVIYVTVHSDFDTRAQSVLAGGNDLISKPVLPMELSVKVVMHLLKNSTQP